MGAPSSHPQSIVLDHCWVCNEKFIDVGGTKIKEEHHVVPRAYGGTDGPTVSLCDGHHSKLHRIAICMKTNKPFFTYLNGDSPQQIKQVLYLANQVYNAELVMRKDPNKAAQAITTLNQRHRAMCDQLKRVYPNAKSREAILLLGLEALYSRHFVSSK